MAGTSYWTSHEIIVLPHAGCQPLVSPLAAILSGAKIAFSPLAVMPLKRTVDRVGLVTEP